MRGNDSFPSFTRPPLDGSLTLPELYDWHYVHNRDHLLFIFENGLGSQRLISMGEGVQGIHRATRYLHERIGDVLIGKPNNNPPVIAILASSESIAYFCTIIGAQRTGSTVFPISPRNSAPAIAFLLSETKAISILVSSEPSVQQLAKDAIKISEQTDLQKIDMPLFEHLFPTEGFDPQFDIVPSATLDLKAAASIYHSSGTTSFPKPIHWSHEALFWMSLIPTCGNTAITGSVWGCHCVPVFHAMGLLPLSFPASVGVTLAVFEPRSPPIVPNPDNVFEGTLATKAEYIFTPPAFLEIWSQTPSYVDAMCKMKGVIYGGGPLAKHAGDLLASKGINIFLTYASTQTSILSEVLPKKPGMAWDYFKFSANRTIHLEAFGDNEYEVVVLASEEFTPNVTNVKVNGVDGFATSDLVSPHPTMPDYYKVVGRADDQIMHSNGEKTNPGPLEAMLSQDLHIEAAIVFGRGRFQCGVLIQPVKGFAPDLAYPTEVSDYLNAIWPTVEKVNEFAPSHSRIFKEMIIVASPIKPFEYTSKETLRRQYMIDTYSSEIDAIYDAVEESAQSEIVGPKNWSHNYVLQFARNVVERTMKKDPSTFGDEADLFEHGLDSLQATWVRNTIMRVLRGSYMEVVHKLSSNFVYEHPTISSLTSYVYSNVTGHSVPEAELHDARKIKLLALVDKYTSLFPNFIARPRESTGGYVVLLTGGTGSLGVHLLANLLQSTPTARVYALSRPSSDAPLDKRLANAFDKEGLDLELLRSDKLVLLEGNPSKGDFGIGAERYTELLSSVTHVIHNAWRVNFSNTIASFETNIRSVRNFVDFCLSCKGNSPARLVFISSIGVFQQSYSETAKLEEPLQIQSVALGSGYGESKWVSEQILNEAAKRSASRITVIRPGQITGGIRGSWNEHEWFPSLIKSSVILGKLPMIDGAVSWITADVAAGAILDMLESEEQVFHLVHPRPVKWSQLIIWFSKELNVPVATYGEWLETLERSGTSVHSGNAAEVEAILQRNPALRLLDMFRSAKDHISENLEPLGLPLLASEKAEITSSTLRNAEQVNERSVKIWILFWKKAGYLV